IVEDQTLELLSLNSELKDANSSKKQTVLKQMDEIVKDRENLLSSLIEKDPKEILKIALSNKMRRFLPASIQNEVEKETSLEGSLEVFHSDNLDEGRSRFYYFLKKADGKRISLHFADGEPKVLSGSKVKVTGLLLGKKMVVASSGGKYFKVLKEADVLAAATEKKVAVLLFNFQNDTSEPLNQDFARGVTFTNSNSATAYYKEISFDNLSLVGNIRQDGDVFGWYTIPFNNTNCSFSNVINWANAARSAAAADGFAISNYNYEIYAFPRTSACHWGGLAVISGSGSWINGSGNFNLRIVAHELGHNFGAHHANTLKCTDANGNRVPISTNCISIEYGDPFDIMGGSTKHMNNFHKGRLGWYEPANTQTVTSNGTYTIVPIEKKLGGVQALRIPRDVNQNGNISKYYYLEYRQPFGFDNFSTSNSVVNGVSIRLAPNYNVFQRPALIDTNTSTGSFKDAALAVGQTFFDPIKNITISTISKDSNRATVEISFGSQPCVRVNPSISVTPLSQWGDPGQTLSYQVRVTNNDSLACSSSTFLTTATLPAGFSQSPTSFSASLSPQNNLTRTINITSLNNTVDGFYTFTQTATNTSASAFSASVSANYNVGSTDINPPTVSITSPSNGATVSDTTIISVSATDNVGVNNVKFYVDNSLKSTDTSSPYNFSWNTKTVSNGSHTLLAKAFDNAGNVGTSATVLVNISNEKPDIQSPSVPTGLKAKAFSSTRIDLTWNASSDNVGVAGYRIYRNTKLIKTTTAKGYRDTKVSAGKTYSYQVAAFDAAGNTSAKSSVVKVGTPGTGTPKKKGDLNGDGRINIRDLSILISRWGTKGGVADINGDGRVNIRDLSILISQWGK
ncbi:hypothetical protein IID23_05035, partial [Patescibacteria group bacterium]|nr:hypothetical protein [Patescibacteria group bacterium]